MGGSCGEWGKEEVMGEAGKGNFLGKWGEQREMKRERWGGRSGFGNG